MQLSKSEYMMFLKHPAWLWLKKRDKEKLPPIDANTQAVFDAGNLFESFADRRFTDAVRVGFTNYDSYLSMPARTQEVIASGAKVILQGRFEAGRITFICDAVELVDEHTVDLYEIKSSTKVKDEHIYELAFQTAVLLDCGYRVRRAAVVHVNSEYVRSGPVDHTSIAVVEDVSERVFEKLLSTRKHIVQALEIIDRPTIPSISPSLAKLSSVKDWLEIYRGLVKVDDFSIYDLCIPKAELIGKLEQAKIKFIEDIPADFDLDDKQRRQVEATQLNAPIINLPKIKEFLQSLEYPLYFFDYETLSGVVPEYDGLRPYEQLPFQYSLHVLDSPTATLRQVEYLHRSKDNPVTALSESLSANLGPTGSVLVWWEGFEKKCNLLLGRMAPEYADFYEQLNLRIKDLMVPFASGWYVDRAFLGSASIKNVLPVLVPELSYAELGIHEGKSAQRLWMQAVLANKSSINKEKLFADLVEYCGLDTQAMVEIYKRLCSLVYD